MVEAHELHEIGVVAAVGAAQLGGHAQAVLLHQITVARAGGVVGQLELGGATEDPVTGHRQPSDLVLA